MSLITLIVTIAVLGVVVWAITTYIPMPAPFKTAIIAVSAFALLFWLLSAFGLLGRLDVVRIGRR